MKRTQTRDKGVSPVIAVLLMIAIAVAAAILVYVWSMGIIGTLTGGGGQQVKEQVILDAYKWTATTCTLYLRNVGSSEVVVDAAYIGGNVVSSNIGMTLSVQGPMDDLILSPGGATYVPGVAYTLKLVTKTGGVFSFSVVYGSGA